MLVYIEKKQNGQLSWLPQMEYLDKTIVQVESSDLGDNYRDCYRVVDAWKWYIHKDCCRPVIIDEDTVKNNTWYKIVHQAETCRVTRRGNLVRVTTKVGCRPKFTTAESYKRGRKRSSDTNMMFITHLVEATEEEIREAIGKEEETISALSIYIPDETTRARFLQGLMDHGWKWQGGGDIRPQKHAKSRGPYLFLCRDGSILHGHHRDKEIPLLQLADLDGLASIPPEMTIAGHDVKKITSQTATIGCTEVTREEVEKLLKRMKEEDQCSDFS